MALIMLPVSGVDRRSEKYYVTPMIRKPSVLGSGHIYLFIYFPHIQELATSKHEQIIVNSNNGDCRNVKRSPNSAAGILSRPIVDQIIGQKLQILVF